jgi:hypothetical protein
MSIEKRLRHLEGLDGGKPCERCGGGLRDLEVASPVEYEIHWLDVPELSDIEDPGPELCPACGRRLVTVVEWLDLPIQGGGVRT